jgi:uncharacterized protein
VERSVVSNTSPLIALAKIDKIFIFKDLFGNVWIPESVSAEFLSNCTGEEKSRFDSSIGNCISVAEISETRSFTRNLGAGEKDALSLAIEMDGILVIDDKKGRNEAKEQGVDTVSTRAVLKIAEEKRIIQNFQEVEKELKRKCFFVPSYD